jgi:transposase
MKEKDVIYPIRRDYLNGMSFAAISRKYYIDQRTAKRYALQNLSIEAYENRVYPSVLDPFKPQIDEWLLNGPMFATIIRDHLVEIGCECGYTIVNDYVRDKIREYEDTGVYANIKHVAQKNAITPLAKVQIEKRERGK